MTGPHEESSADGKSPPEKEVVLDLNFVPDWAKQPAGTNPYTDAHYSTRDRPRRRDRDRHGPRPGGPGGGRGGPRRPDRGRPRPDDEARRGDRDERAHRPYAPRPPREDLPLDVSFLPDRDKLGLLVREIHRRKRAYPLVELAGLMLHRPDDYLVKLQAHPSKGENGGLSFFQCKRCRTVFRRREDALAHTSSAHLEESFDATEVELEVPTGNFVCVCRCRKTGTLLGPPNYHGYQAKVQQVMSEHFPTWTADRYRDQIETVHDPDLVETWRSERRTRKEYRVKGEEESPVMSADEARAHFAQHHAERMIHKTHRVILPAAVARALGDESVKGMIREAWQRENRFPFTMSLALRPAFKHMRLFMFKIDERRTFVTPIHPSPVDPAHAVDSVREILGHLEDHPGCKLKALVEALRPGAASDTPEVAELVRQCKWLIDKGHLIEFFDGALALPSLKKGR